MEYLFFLIYDIVFILGLSIYLPFYIRRKKINLSALKQKIGLIEKTGLGRHNTIWIHVVSVGELNLIEKLTRRIHELFNYEIIITTTTLSANSLARKKYAKLAKIFFFPFDISFIINKTIKAFRPKIFIAAETELWPNLFYRLKKKNIPIVIVNARISDRAFKRYKIIRPFMRKVLKKCSYIGVQNESYKNRFVYLGANINTTLISGNMKFESLDINENQLDSLRKKYLNLLKQENSCLIVAGSTHNPEEESLLAVYKEINALRKNISLLIAPRHPERIPVIEKIVKAYGFNPVKISDIDRISQQSNNVFLLDTIGELLYFYSFSDISFVGGSLSNYGGHNILEPIFFLKPTIFGPNMANFQDIKEIILKNKAGIQIENCAGLKEKLLELIDNNSLRKELSLHCAQVFEEERKSLDENLKIILQCVN
ncbi:MAG: 3-deoxy-D-manno-octulosonic acid transferase [Candidatus Omnitrophica bacterium]|jgi:3-deoxy-D-manno-octulosonic-acid transferase|nr:3-deoxy-D-manno-octulosonic acid transferase [Candidatus Omnitrophota bacterium]